MRFRKPPGRVTALLLLALAASAAGVPENLSRPVAPCDGNEALPAFSPTVGRPATRLWQATELANPDWVPPACTGWTDSAQPQWVAALAGEFRFDGDTAALLGRVGSISSLPNLRYWSADHGRWQAMARDAAALDGTDPRGRRSDFSALEFSPGRDLYYWIDDERIGPAVYRMRILERTPDRAVIASENATPIRFLFFTLFRPGELRAVEFLQRRAADRWQVYLLSRIDRRSAFLGQGDEVSSVNRLVALYRQLADLPAETGGATVP